MHASTSCFICLCRLCDSAKDQIAFYVQFMQKSRGCTYFFPATVSEHKRRGWNEAHVQMIANSCTQTTCNQYDVIYSCLRHNISVNHKQFSSSKPIRWVLDHANESLAAAQTVCLIASGSSPPAPLSSLNSCFTAVCIMDDSGDEYSRIINVRLTDSDVSYGRL